MLNRIRKAMTEKEQGFTLIELLVVIIIIGILAAIAIPVFLKQRQKGVDAAIKSDVRNAATSAESYLTDHPTEVGPAGVSNPDREQTLRAEGWAPTADNQFYIVTKPGIGYCIAGWNPNSSHKTQVEAVLYDSAAGGLQPTNTPATAGACAA